MVSLEKINKLASGQQKILHERVGKFLNNHLREMKELCLVDEAQLVDYVAKTAVSRGEFKPWKPDQSLNEALYPIMDAIEKKSHEGETIKVLAELIKIFTMYYQSMKNVDESLKLIHSFHNQEVKVGEFEGISDVTTSIRLDDNVIYIDYSLPATSESWNLIRSLSSLHIEFDGKQYVAETGNFYIESTKDDIGDGGLFTGNIRINHLKGSDFLKIEEAYFRCMIPIGSVDWNRDIRTFIAYFRNSWTSGLIELKNGDTLLHVYPFSDGKKKYMVVESLTETTMNHMLKIVYSVSLTLGFITGAIHLGKCYMFSSSEPEYGKEIELAYLTMRTSSETSMRIFTTNMYYVREALKAGRVKLQDISPLYDTEGKFQKHLQDLIQPNILQSLFSLIHGDEKISRAVVTTIESAHFPLEYQAGVRAIVLEPLACSAPGPKPIPDDGLWNEIKAAMEDVVKRYTNNEAGEKQISDESLNVLIKKINSMNNPTNADSLARPLEEVGYVLSANDKYVLKTRNTFLHGGLVKGSADTQTSEIFYLSLMLHKLACVIILKKAGFEGYILNNPILFNCKKAVDAGEKVLIMI